MSNKLDNFFSDKLREHEVAPSPKAWEKLESNLAKKNNTAVVLRFAAAIALVAAASIVIVNQTIDRQAKTTAQQEVKTKAVESAPDARSSTEAPAPIKQQKTEVAQTTRRPVIKSKNEDKEIKSEPEATHEGQLVVMETNTVEAEVIPPRLSSGQAQESASVKTKRIVIVYNLPTINKTTPPAIVEEKKSGLQKVMDVAMDMRAAENPLGDLREAKDELFALEFKKDRNKTN